MSSQAQAPSARYQWVHHEQTSSSIYLKWDKPISDDSVDYVDIRYKKENEKVHNIAYSTGDNEITLYNLTSDVVYIIKAYIINEDGYMIKLFETVCRTNQSHLHKIFKESTLIHGRDKLQIYKLPSIKYESDTGYFKQCHIFSKQPYDPMEKTILVMGASGTGKRTFINAMINYIADVSYEDEIRLIMVDPSNKDESHISKKNLSQLTTAPTCYRTPLREEFNIDAPLNIIDIPGFGFPRYQMSYEHIPLQIKHVLDSVGGIVHSVCIVVPLSQTRLVVEEQRAYTSILGLFDADINKNTHPCLTFDDGRATMVLSNLEAAGIPFEKYFRFNNANLFELGREEAKEIFKRRCCERMKSFEDFFSEIRKVSPQHLKK